MDLLNNQFANNELMKPSPRKDTNVIRLSQLAKQWIPFGKKFVLEGVVVANLIVSSEPQKTIALGTAWQPTFNNTTFNFDKAKTYFENFGDIGQYCDKFAPSYLNFRMLLARDPALCLDLMHCLMLLGRLVETWKFVHLC